MSYDEHQAMWPQMIAALAAIDAALGLPDGRGTCSLPLWVATKIAGIGSER